MAYLILLRPYKWIKNLLIFAPLIFAGQLFEPDLLFRSILAFIIFSLASSTAYIVNDIIDHKNDREHSWKRHRPLASGDLSLRQGWLTALFLFALSLLIIFTKLPVLLVPILLYLLLNFCYSLFLKHVATLDILLIAFLYIIRIVSGGLATNIPVSEWLLVCTFSLALFLVIAKRRAEFVQVTNRKVLQFYSQHLLESYLTISATLSIVTFSLYSILVLKSPFALVSLIFVCLGIFRFMTLVYIDNGGEDPEKLILSDKTLIASIFFWGVFLYFSLYSDFS